MENNAERSLTFETSIPVALLFIAAMFSFFLGLLLFLREISWQQ